MKIYLFYIAGDKNWTVIDASAGWGTDSPLSGDWFVLRRVAAWANGVGSQYPELLFCANDEQFAAKTYGGAGGTKWTIAAGSYNMIYSPDGGWDDTNHEFVAPGALAEQQLVFALSSVDTAGHVFLVDTPDDLTFWIYSTANVYYVYGHAGEVLGADDAATTPRPTIVTLGRFSLANQAQYIGFAGKSKVPNAARTGWADAMVDDPTYRGDTYSLSADGGLIHERPCLLWNASVPGGVIGHYIHTRRASTAIVAGTTTTDGTRVYYLGLSFPWA
jgi:hypothetical protein